MSNDPEVSRWASLMLTVALRGNLNSDSIDQLFSILRNHHGDEIFKKVLEQVLLEAEHIGPAHRTGSLYAPKTPSRDARPESPELYIRQ